jgi:hypothetical protein
MLRKTHLREILPTVHQFVMFQYTDDKTVFMYFFLESGNWLCLGGPMSVLKRLIMFVWMCWECFVLDFRETFSNGKALSRSWGLRTLASQYSCMNVKMMWVLIGTTAWSLNIFSNQPQLLLSGSSYCSSTYYQSKSIRHWTYLCIIDVLPDIGSATENSHNVRK